MRRGDVYLIMLDPTRGDEICTNCVQWTAGSWHEDWERLKPDTLRSALQAFRMMFEHQIV